MHIIESSFWIKLLLLLGIYVTLSFLFSSFMRKWLKVEKKNSFSYNHVNDRHRKIDWTIRITFIVVTILWYIISMMLDLMYTRFLWLFFVCFFIIIEIVRAYMEWKYSENKKDYIFTISQLAFAIIFLILFVTSVFFGLLG